MAPNKLQTAVRLFSAGLVLTAELVLAGGCRPPQPAKVRVLVDTAPRQEAFIEREPRRRSAAPDPDTTEIDSLLAALEHTSASRKKLIKGYRRDIDRSDTVLLNTARMRVTVVDFYQGRELRGYVLSIENLTSQWLQLKSGMLPLRAIHAARFRRSSLGPRPSRLLPEDSDHSTLAYVVAGDEE